ncbi:hypothetical protein KSS87_003520 [Heliosperma pusillum]|nr:hypothetical protein KSS87_003520 [Heliosperma pusillum]
MRISSFSSLFLGVILVALVGHCYGQLKIGFYHGKCGEKDVENVIYEVVKHKISSDPDTVSDLVRLGGIKAVNDLKAAVEKACPGVVSCADTLVIGARAAISLAGGKWFEVETGRRDGRVSLRSEAQANIPPPTMSIPTAIKLFASKGLNKDDFVILLGGHTVGTAHCHSFKERLYNFHNTNKPDPSISSSMLQLLRKTCPLNSNVDNETFLDQTPNSHFKIDNAYYKQILAHNGTMEIDQNLASSSLTRGMVEGLAYSRTQFLDQFGPAMVKMARIGVLTGYQGEIRKTCGSVN